MNEEVNMLEEISSYYKNGDLMDEMIVDREVSLIKNMVQNTGRTLEIGCGNGYSTERLIKIFDDYYVLEPSHKNMELMKERLGTEINMINELLEDFQTDRKFDHILFLNVLEHVADPILSLEKIGELLSEEGRVFISVPNCMSLNRRAGFEMGLLESHDQFAPKDYQVGHRRLYTVEMLKEHIESANLELETMKGVFLKPLAESQMMELGLDAIKAFYSLGEDIPQYCANLFAVAKKKNYEFV
ncbi:2-polyprenyl-3-methyl-5-hydroxy-6-metoxy-1,4-benzoquinol methylase [Paenibacillus sp. DS2015]|uniref:class I SAM-dependent methyltransferase n=1 Tax=Paenibacillus sp. DS2015 TaxID=3373917 RepID=UPI003D2202CE